MTILVYHTQDGIVSITLYLFQSTEESNIWKIKSRYRSNSKTTLRTIQRCRNNRGTRDA